MTKQAGHTPLVLLFTLRAEHGYFRDPLTPFTWRVHPETADDLIHLGCRVRLNNGLLEVFGPPGGGLPSEALAFGLVMDPDGMGATQAMHRPGAGPLAADLSAGPSVLDVTEYVVIVERELSNTIPVIAQGAQPGDILTVRFPEILVRYVYDIIGLDADEVPFIDDSQNEVTFSAKGGLDVVGRPARRWVADTIVPLTEAGPARFSLIRASGDRVILPLASPTAVSRTKSGIEARVVVFL